MGKRWPLAVAASMVATHLCLTILTYLSMYGEREFLPDITRRNLGFLGFNWLVVLIILSAVFVIVAFKLSVRLYETERPSSQVLRALAFSLNADNLNAKIAGDRLLVRVQSWTAVEISAVEEGGKTTVSARAGATASGWAVILILAVALSSYAMVALIVALFVFARAHAFINRRLLKPVADSNLDRPVSELLDLRKGIIHTLLEGRRIASDAHRSVQLSYRLKVFLVLFVGILMLPSVITSLVHHAFPDPGEVPSDLFLYVFLSSCLIGLALIVRLRGRVKPVIDEYRQWEGRFDRLLARETSDKKDDLDESAVDGLAEVAERIEIWTREQSRANAFSDPLTWLLIMILLYIQLGLLMNFVQSFQPSGISFVVNLAVLVTVEVILGSISYFLISRNRRMQQRYRAYSDEDWRARKAWINSELEKTIEEVSHDR